MNKPYLSNISPQLLSTLVSILLSACLISGCSDNSFNGKTNTHDPLKQLADSSGTFKMPSPENEISFPDAHSPHKAYRQEWWYLTANLVTEDGQPLATQWTLFRRAVEDKHWYFAHAALANNKTHQSSYRNGREEFGSVAISSEPFTATIDDWSWQSTSHLLPAKLNYGSGVGAITDNSVPRNNKIESKHTEQYWQVNLSLNTDQPYFLQGKNGFSQKHPSLNIASHYYSQPFIEVSGEVFWQGRWQKVTGNAWFDREWGSQMLAQDQQGWDWFSLRLNEKTALMIYRLRSNEQDYTYASIMEKDGKIRTLATDEVQIISKNAKRSNDNSPYPAAFTLVIAKENINLDVQVVNEKQIMRFGIEYFEGMVNFSGSHSGQGFLEMTGYNH